MHILVIAISITLLSTLSKTVHSQDQIEYTIQIGLDGSATWIINQVLSANNTFSSPIQFQEKVTSLVKAAENYTDRQMSVDLESIILTPSDSYIVIEYTFSWKNFSQVKNERIIVGDVFQVENFSQQLFGDGFLYITYPSQCVVETISPFPDKRDDSIQMLKWFGIQEFINRSPTIILRNKASTTLFLEFFWQNGILILGLFGIAAGTLSFYMLKYRKKKQKGTVNSSEFAEFLTVATEEEKIVRLLRSSGGSLNQSKIVDQCKFSKAKTSQLLKSLEQKGIVSRHKKGRDKIVFLVEQERE